MVRRLPPMAGVAWIARPALLAAAGWLAASGAWAQDGEPTEGGRPDWWPQQLFVQAGDSHESRSAVAGVGWDSGWRAQALGGHWTLYTELAAGRWVRDHDARRDPTADAWFTQVGVAPVLRWQSDEGRGWFLEGAIGLNLISPVYQRQSKRFSTSFNFGDHLAAGYRFGERGQHEIALRIEHFSNAGLRLPNPGENFRQLRYAWRL